MRPILAAATAACKRFIVFEAHGLGFRVEGLSRAYGSDLVQGSGFGSHANLAGCLRGWTVKRTISGNWRLIGI